MGPELYFILIYNMASRQLEIHEFGQDHAAASDAYSTLELEHRHDHAMEVVLVGADSIETIHKTHSHYFADQADDLFRQFLDATPASRAQQRARRTHRSGRTRRRGSVAHEAP